jgi:ribonuclease G
MTEASQEFAGEPGAKRWRGRRRRRGGRGTGSALGTPAESAESAQASASEAPEPETEFANEIHAEAAPARSPRGERESKTFMLPGESLSKYGGAPAEAASKTAPETQAPARPVSTFKPSTLIETPIKWDGSGLLPGETLSRRSGREAGPELPAASAEMLEMESASPDEIEEEQFVEETIQHGSHATAEQSEVQPSSNEPFISVNDEYTEEIVAAAPEEPVLETPGDLDISALAGASSTDAPLDEEAALATGHDDPMEVESDRSASHHVDPLPPAGFRFFGFGGKKKGSDEEPSLPPPVVEETRLSPAPPVSAAFSPGTGLVEEEVIEGEEFEAPHHHHKIEEHDLDEYEEEEKRQTQIRSGELGEMLQEAHLDHRIQLNFDEKNGDEEGEEALEGEEEEEEEAVAGDGQPAGEAQSRQRRERGGRGRRGRGGQGNRRGASRRSMQTSDLPIISDLLKPGQEILVQIAKEPIAKKGARITSHIALPGRFLVFMPTVSHVGVSRKIASDEERQRLKRILTHERGNASGGFIVRTAAEGASEEELRADLRFLIHLWDEIKQRSDNSKSPALIYHDLSLIERILRDQVSSNFSSIWVDSEADYERIVRFLNRFSPSLVRRVKLYTKETPLFEHFGIQDEISKALRSKVWLKSGGSIVINQTEALVAIDINTGKYVGKTARLEDTILKTNLDAIPEIVRQIRLRDLGGIIVIDFIDMDERKNRFKVMAALEEALKNDRAPTKVLQFNDFGLVAITRKRVKQSLERTLSVPCPTCQATGMVKSPATVCNEIFIELRKMKRHLESPDVVLRVNPETVKVLKGNNAAWITEFEELIGKNILIKSDPSLHPEQFDIQG